ncbi:MAG: hypothetical protein WAX85_03065 [Minisyncoccia bacterium]
MSISQVSKTEASEIFGRIIHGVAVEVAKKVGKGKSELARRIGADKALIKTITLGGAHLYDREVLDRLISAVKDDIHPKELERVIQLVEQIKPKKFDS